MNSAPPRTTTSKRFTKEPALPGGPQDSSTPGQRLLWNCELKKPKDRRSHETLFFIGLDRDSHDGECGASRHPSDRTAGCGQNHAVIGTEQRRRNTRYLS